MKRFVRLFLIFMIFFVGSVVYTLPGSMAIFEGRTDLFMSDGTDLTTSPFQFDMLHEGFKKDPSLLFYGAYPNSRLDAPEGYVAWYAFIEKVAGAFLPLFVPVEQVAALFALILMALNGLCFYGMARRFDWNRGLSLGLSMAWAFSAYARARAQVHPGLMSTYVIPLAFWGIAILQRDRTKKGTLKSTLCFLGCATAVHYYLIFLAAFSPFFFAFYMSAPDQRKRFSAALGRIVLAALPALFFLLFGLLRPVPQEFRSHAKNLLPTTGQSTQWPHPFLATFSADPQDYFSGDLAVGTTDWNPLRRWVDEDIRQHLRGNLHEHALGLRWMIWLTLLICGAYAIRHRARFKLLETQGGALMVLCAFGAFAFLASLAPDWGLFWGPSAWVHYVVEQIRVPSRFGILVHFSVLFLIGIVSQEWLHTTSLKKRTVFILTWLFPALVILDSPPGLNPMPMAPIAASLAPQIALKAGTCGLGYHFPHVSSTSDPLRFYYLLQVFRGTECSFLNPATPNERDLKLTQIFGYQNKGLIDKVLKNEESARRQLITYADCAQLDWLYFDSRVPRKFVQQTCAEWQGVLAGPDLCRSQKKDLRALPGVPDQCLDKIQ